MFTIDTGGVEAMVRDLAVYAGHGSNTEQALKVTTGKILDTAISRTPISTESEFVSREVAFAGRLLARYDLLGGDGVLTTNQGIRGILPAGTQWTREMSVRTGKSTYYIMRGGSERHWSNERWARYQATAAQHAADLKVSRAVAAKRARQSVGLTRQGWVQIADDLKIPLNSARLEKIRAAVGFSGNQHQSGRGWLENGDDGIFIDIENSFPFKVTDGAGILQSAIDTRLAGFANDLKHGVFEDLATFAKRYRGLDIQPN